MNRSPRGTKTAWLALAYLALAACENPSTAPSEPSAGNSTGAAGASTSGGAGAGAPPGSGGRSGAAGEGATATHQGGNEAGAGKASSTGGTTAGGRAEEASGGAGGWTTSAGSASTGASGGPGGSHAGGAAGASGAGQTSAATFTEIWNRTLEVRCATPYCHDGSGRGWSGFDKATAYRTLVGVASTSCRDERRVVASDPAASVLVSAISHSTQGSCNVPAMPSGASKLPQTEIDRVISWIRAGANDD